MKVTLVMQQGPMLGRQREIDFGPMSNELIIGRDPGPGGLLLEADTTVSRRHGRLIFDAGRLIFENSSPNGTLVDGTMVMGQKPVAPGTVLTFGIHEIALRFRPIEATTVSTRGGGEAGGSSADEGSLWNHGPLGNPLVRLLLAAYLGGLLAFAIVMIARGPVDTDAAFEKVRETYVGTYLPSTDLDEEAREARVEAAERLVAELEAHIAAGRWALAEDACHAIMGLDGGDTDSPLVGFAAQRLGELTRRRRG